MDFDGLTWTFFGMVWFRVLLRGLCNLKSGVRLLLEEVPEKRVLLV